jgi:hypothetical protein
MTFPLLTVALDEMMLCRNQGLCERFEGRRRMAGPAMSIDSMEMANESNINWTA